MAAEVRFVFELQDIVFIDKMGGEGIIVSRGERIDEDLVIYKYYEVLNNLEAIYTEEELTKLNATGRCRHVWAASDDPEFNSCKKCGTRKKVKELQ